MQDKFIFGKHWVCMYCGEYGEDIEHCIPVSQTKGMQTNGSKDMFGLLTFSCRQCNLIASSKNFKSFEDKCIYINDRLRVKYKKHLRHVEWDKEEIKELGGNLKKYVRGFNTQTKIAKRRCFWIYTNEFYDVLEKAKEDILDTRLSLRYKEFLIGEEIT